MRLDSNIASYYCPRYLDFSIRAAPSRPPPPWGWLAIVSGIHPGTTNTSFDTAILLRITALFNTVDDDNYTGNIEFLFRLSALRAISRSRVNCMNFSLRVDTIQLIGCNRIITWRHTVVSTRSSASAPHRGACRDCWLRLANEKSESFLSYRFTEKRGPSVLHPWTFCSSRNRDSLGIRDTNAAGFICYARPLPSK